MTPPPLPPAAVFCAPTPTTAAPRLPVADPRKEAAGPPWPGPLLAPRHHHVTRLPRSNWTADTPVPTFVCMFIFLSFPFSYQVEQYLSRVSGSNETDPVWDPGPEAKDVGRRATPAPHPRRRPQRDVGHVHAVGRCAPYMRVGGGRGLALRSVALAVLRAGAQGSQNARALALCPALY